MYRLVKFEFRNLLKQKAFLICLLISSALIVIGILASNFINQMAEQTGDTSVLLGVNAFDSILGYLAGGNLSLLLAIMISIYFGFEVSDGTVKNIISKGYTRGQFFISKLISVVIGAIIFIILAIAVNYLMCLIMNISIGTLTSDQIIKLLSVSFAIIAETIMFSSISYIIFKTSANIVANICIPLLLPLILALADVLLKINTKLSDFWIENTYKLVTSASKIPFVIGLSLCYIVVFTVLGLILSKRKEIK